MIQLYMGLFVKFERSVSVGTEAELFHWSSTLTHGLWLLVVIFSYFFFFYFVSCSRLSWLDCQLSSTR